MTTPVLVEVDRISRSYGALKAVDTVSFTIHRGEIVGFLGPNGAGKTTTMQILTGNLAPSEGRVRIDGHDLAAEPRRAKRQIGYLPELPPLYRDLMVDEYLDYCAALHQIPRAQRHAARTAAKEKCGLADTGRRLIGNLSKGFQQRVGLAQAILHMPPVVILDEPTSGLDPIQIREIRELIRGLGREHSVLLSTHILSEVQAVCDRVQIIHQGKLVLSDTIDRLAHHLKSAMILVAFRAAPDLGALAQLPGVRDVATNADGRVRVAHDAGRDPTDAIVRLAAERGWGLYEVGPERASLEQVFLSLTTATDEPAPEAVT